MGFPLSEQSLGKNRQNMSSRDLTVTDSEDSTESQGRDEVKEILKLSRKETKRVQTWRLLVTLALLATGIIVTSTTYRSLVAQEEANFEDAVSDLGSQTVDVNENC